MTATTLDVNRIQRLANTEHYPPISADQLRELVGVLGATPDPSDDDPDPAWDLAWAIAEHMVHKTSPELVGDIMEIGHLAEQIYPLCRAGLATRGATEEA